MADPPPPYRESLQGQAPSNQYPYSSAPPPPHPAGAYANPGYPAQGYPPKQGQPYPPQQPQGYGAIPGSYQQSNVVVSQYPPQTVIMVGGCPACRVGVLEDDFTCLGVLCAILFFPLGLLCCFAMRQRRCVHCGAVFG